MADPLSTAAQYLRHVFGTVVIVLHDRSRDASQLPVVHGISVAPIGCAAQKAGRPRRQRVRVGGGWLVDEAAAWHPTRSLSPSAKSSKWVLASPGNGVHLWSGRSSWSVRHDHHAAGSPRSTRRSAHSNCRRTGMGLAVAWLRQIGMGAVEARNHLSSGSAPGWRRFLAWTSSTDPKAGVRGSGDDASRAAGRRRRRMASETAAGLQPASRRPRPRRSRRVGHFRAILRLPRPSTGLSRRSGTKPLDHEYDARRIAALVIGRCGAQLPEFFAVWVATPTLAFTVPSVRQC